MTTTTTRDWSAVGFTLLWPGLGHLLQGRTTRGLLLTLWATTSVLAWHMVPALGISRGYVVAELLLIAVIACTDAARPQPR